MAVDDAELLLCRADGRPRLFEALLGLVATTSRDTAWLVGVGALAWRRLVHQLGAERVLSEVLELPPLGPEALRALLAARADAAGVTLVVEGPQADEGAEPETARLGAEPQDDAPSERRVSGFLEALADASGGAPGSALAWALLAAQPGSDPKALHLARPPRVDDSGLDALGLRERLALAEVLAHGGLAAPEHAELFRTPERESRFTLERLVAERVLERAPAAERYRVHRLVAGRVAERLAAQGLACWGEARR